MESRTRYRILSANLPAPQLQIPVRLSGGRYRFLDLGWEDRQVGVDYEGEEFHTGTGALSRDRSRHNGITDAGWLMLYPVATTIYQEHHSFIDMLDRALRSRPPRPTPPATYPRTLPPPTIWT